MENRFYLDGYISDVGDLHTFRAHRELDGTGLVAKIGQVYPKVLESAMLHTLDSMELYENGYTAVQIRNYDPAYALDFKVARLTSASGKVGTNIYPGSRSDLLLYRDGVLEAVIINGGLAYSK
jgi:hypothetical protein